MYTLIYKSISVYISISLSPSLCMYIHIYIVSRLMIFFDDFP